jgi:hypothetical protein
MGGIQAMTKLFMELFMCTVLNVPLAGAQSALDDTNHDAAALYPLHKCDTWRYVNPRGSLWISVGDTVTLDGTGYVQISETFSKAGAAARQEKHFVRTKYGRVMKLILPCAGEPKVTAERGLCALAGTDWIWYDFTSSERGAWQSFGNSYTSDTWVDEFQVMLITARDTVRTADTVFTNCWKFKIHSVRGADGDIFEWFAPGVGMVRRGWGGDARDDYRLVDFHVRP